MSATVTPRDLQLPLSEQAVRSLHAGDYVELSGTLLTGRDAVHKYLAGGGQPPCPLDGMVIYHCGPVVVRTGTDWRVTAAGPTTSIREEPYMAAVIGRYGLRGVIGKGGMGARTLAACAEHGCVYFHTVGGAAQVLARAITRVSAVHLETEFGSPEAIWVLDVSRFPAVVTMDTHGVNLHETISRGSAQRLEELLHG